MINSVFFIGGALIGAFIVKYGITPARVFRFIKRKIKKPEKVYGPWSIGILEGEDPFSLKKPNKDVNPILTGKEIHDCDAIFVADPFFALQNGNYYLFFEVLCGDQKKGVIAYATSKNGYDWNYRKIILTEPFHLSYPYIFQWENDWYMIPETNEDFSVRLYKAARFPDEWVYVGNILSGYDYVDPSIFRKNGKWWMFVSTTKSNVLNLYYSEELASGWIPHPMNPLIKSNPHISRPAGRILQYENRYYRFAQDVSPIYGKQVFAFEILELTETNYREKEIENNPFISGSKEGWNAEGMHHLDIQKIGNQWFATTDGRWTK